MTLHQVYNEVMGSLGFPTLGCGCVNHGAAFIARLNAIGQRLRRAPKLLDLFIETREIDWNSGSGTVTLQRSDADAFSGQTIHRSPIAIPGPIRLQADGKPLIRVERRAEWDQYPALSGTPSTGLPKAYYVNMTATGLDYASGADDAPLTEAFLSLYPVPAEDMIVEVDLVEGWRRIALDHLNGIDGGQNRESSLIVHSDSLTKNHGVYHNRYFMVPTDCGPIAIRFKQTSPTVLPGLEPIPAAVRIVDVAVDNNSTSVTTLTSSIITALASDPDLYATRRAIGHDAADNPTSIDTLYIGRLKGGLDFDVTDGTPDGTLGTTAYNDALPYRSTNFLFSRVNEGADFPLPMPSHCIESYLLPLLRWEMLSCIGSVSDRQRKGAETLKADYDRAMIDLGLLHPSPPDDRPSDKPARP